MTLEEIKDYFESNVGSKIVIVQKISHRTTSVRYEGIVEGAYPNLFILTLQTKSKNKKITFSYRDVLTRIIEVEGIF